MEQPLRNLGPMPPAPPLAGTPPQGYAGDFHRSVADLHDLTAAWNSFLQAFRPTYLTTKDGRRVECLVRTDYRDTSTNLRPFGATNISEGETFRVSINDGIICAPDVSGIGSDPPAIGCLLKEYTVDGAEFDVADGDLIYCEITNAATNYAVNIEDEDDDYVAITIDATVSYWAITTATPGVLKKGTSLPAGTPTKSYRRIAGIAITDGVMEITPYCEEAITVGVITAPRNTAVTITTNIAEQEIDVCDYGVASTITILKAA